jgi:diguanylate cyclase
VQTVRQTPPDSETPIPQLRLDSALSLLGLNGRDLSTGASGDVGWLQSVIDALCELSSRDSLTGLANRRQFELTLARELDRVARGGEPALVLMADIDHFKAVNDTHGHGTGDQVLQQVARALQDCVRPMDTVARVGGEEFAIILPSCAPACGEAVAERVRRRVEAMPIVVGPQQEISVTISLGGAFAPQWVRSSAVLWIERADKQLYFAKASGRNCTRLEHAVVSLVSAEEKGLLFASSQFQDSE